MLIRTGKTSRTGRLYMWPKMALREAIFKKRGTPSHERRPNRYSVRGPPFELDVSGRWEKTTSTLLKTSETSMQKQRHAAFNLKILTYLYRPLILLSHFPGGM